MDALNYGKSPTICSLPHWFLGQNGVLSKGLVSPPSPLATKLCMKQSWRPELVKTQTPNASPRFVKSKLKSGRSRIRRLPVYKRYLA